jgi:hypothetical protein
MKMPGVVGVSSIYSAQCSFGRIQKRISESIPRQSDSENKDLWHRVDNTAFP